MPPNIQQTKQINIITILGEKVGRKILSVFDA
jgi:hypothetical protein